MGLFDYLNFDPSLAGGNGVLSGLYNPLLYPPQPAQQQPVALPQYDPLGTPFAASAQTPPDPFGPAPNLTQWAKQFAPTTVFDTGAAPVPGLQTPPQAPALPPAQTIAPPPQPAPPQQTMGYGGLQVPVFGQPDAAAIPPAARPAGPAPSQLQAQPAPQELPPALGGKSGGFLGGLSDAFQSIGNGGSLLGAITGNYTDPQNITQRNAAAQFHATRQTLIDNGYDAKRASSMAMLAVLNPEAGKTILPEALSNKEEFKTMKDALGGEHGYWVNNRRKTISPADGGGGAGGPMTLGAPQVLAPGVKAYDSSLTGDAYLQQFSPEVKAAVKAHIDGDVLPSGNPRMQAIASFAKTVAQKYGQDMGIPVSDATYSEKRKYRTELGTNSPNSAGGQAKAFNQGISHLAGLAATLEKLDNSNGLGIPMIAKGVNATRQALSTEQSALSDEAKSLGQTVAGEVGKLFSGAAGGGVHERELTRERFDTAKSKPQLAAALRATIETMEGGLKALEQRRDSVLGPNNNVELVSAETKQNIAKIQAIIDRLEGRGGSPSASGIPSGWSVKVR